MKCDVCGDEVKDDVKEWDEHNRKNYVRHVFLSASSDEEAKQIIQSYVNLYGGTRRG